MATFAPTAATASLRTGANPRLVSAALGSLDDGSSRHDASLLTGSFAHAASLLASSLSGRCIAGCVSPSSTVVVRGNSTSTARLGLEAATVCRAHVARDTPATGALPLATSALPAGLSLLPTALCSESGVSFLQGPELSPGSSALALLPAFLGHGLLSPCYYVAAFRTA